jgi:hypothetical protein
MSEKPTKFRMAAEAVALCYTRKELEAFITAIETAMDDSYHFSQDSDEGDNRREVEGQSLDMIDHLFARALDLKPKAT